MWHTDPSLTANVHSAPTLVDPAGAMESLPRLGGGSDGGVTLANGPG
jgi:hypothetical protein